MTFQRGHDLTVRDMRGGRYPVVGSSGVVIMEGGNDRDGDGEKCGGVYGEPAGANPSFALYSGEQPL